jgi:hypothetical protein
MTRRTQADGSPSADLTGATTLFEFSPYATTMTKGVRIAVGDVNADGTPDIIAPRDKDEETRLQNNWNRWYDSRVGRWISEDPIGFWGTDVNLQPTQAIPRPTRLIQPGSWPSLRRPRTSSLAARLFGSSAELL